MTAEVPVTPRPLPVIFALHDSKGSYWLNTAVAITSLLQHSSAAIRIHVLHDYTLGAVARRRLSEIAQGFRTEIVFSEQALPPGMDGSLFGAFSPASVFRLMIPRLFGDEDLVIYLDSDLVVNGLDIQDLAMAAALDAPLSWVRDPFMGVPESHRRNLDRIGLDPADYFNSGVIAMRPKLITSELLAEFSEFFRAHPSAIHPDQDFLNLRFAGATHGLDERFNTIVATYGRRLLQPLSFYARKIIHYSGVVKPFHGRLSPALLPFFAHAFTAPEICFGEAYEAKSYIFPIAGRENGIRGFQYDLDPVTPAPTEAG